MLTPETGTRREPFWKAAWNRNWELLLVAGHLLSARPDPAPLHEAAQRILTMPEAGVMIPILLTVN